MVRKIWSLCVLLICGEVREIWICGDGLGECMSSSPEPGKMSGTQQEFGEYGQDGTLAGGGRA